MNLQKTAETIRKQSPLVVNLTNTVVQNWTANVLLALGASPVMSNDKEDALALTALASALNINIGTFDGDFLDRAFACAKSSKVPIVLDPVGAGATQRRTKTSLDLLPYASIVRGNTGEILALQGAGGQMKGVDSLGDAGGLSPEYFAKNYPNLVVAASGAEDFIFKGTRQMRLPFGVELMTKVTGMGCALSAVTAAFASVESDPFDAASKACAFYALCGEIAYKKSSSPGSFAQAFLDALHAPDWEYISQREKALSAE